MEHIFSGGKDQRGKDQLADEPARRRRGGKNGKRYQLSGGSQQTAVQRRSRLSPPHRQQVGSSASWSRWWE